VPRTKTKPPPSPRGKGQARLGLTGEQLGARFPLLRVLAGPPGADGGRRAWDAALTARPDVMHRILADVIKQTYAKPGRVGQLPMPHEEEVDFQALLYGEDQDRPLTEVLPALMAAKGLGTRSLSERSGVQRATLIRLLRGAYLPNAIELRAIAVAVGKPAAHFVEYRKLMAATALIRMVDEQPGLATRLYRDYLTVRAS